MRAVVIAMCMAALAGAGLTGGEKRPVAIVDSPPVSKIQSIPDPATNASPVCNCKTGGECDCVDCDCDGCPCGEAVAKKTASIDPVTGMAVGGPAIIQLSTQGCLPCVKWEAEEKPKYLRQGWEVPAPVFGTAAPVYPSFRVYDGKRWHQHTGWLTGDDVRRILGGGAANSSSPRVSAGAAMVSVPAAAAASGRDWLIGGRPWTRESLINHLATHSSHGHSLGQLQGMGFEQLNALHNADHEGRRQVRTSAAAPVMSSCPGGSCPPSRSAPLRRGIFGGRR